MTADTLARIGEQAFATQSFDAMANTRGLFWRSEMTITAPSAYQADNPSGLHLGCGIASLSTSSPDLGSFAFQGVGLTAMLYPDGARSFETQIEAGSARACGLYLSMADVEQRGCDPALADVVSELRSGAPLRATPNTPHHLVMRLCAPIDPWFQGAARELASEARALELSALALSWLSGVSCAERPASRHRHHAFAARDLLERRLANPPTLAELAREVGINARTLTDAFRACFDTSIAAYVTARRLDLAALLLGEGLSPTQTARQVGYSAAHLSTAFRRRFGVRPEEMNRSARFRQTKDKC